MTHPALLAPDKRVVCWFSCGATSAVATYLALARYRSSAPPVPVHIVYTDPGSEHPDNVRFLADCERWFDHPITTLKSSKYVDTWDVYEKTRWLVGVQGARCTMELKKALRLKFQEPHRDIQVFGFDAGEVKRADRFRDNNPEVCLWAPLIEHRYAKRDCLLVLKAAGIALPAMYGLGYKNNNCIGCVKGQAGYWNKIRRDFPDVFARMAKVEREIGAAINKSYAGDGKRKPVYLDMLPPTAGRYKDEPPASCGLLCGEFLEDLDACET